MSRGQIDTTLVIKARDEVSGAVKAMEAALDGFLTTQRQVAAGSKSVSTGLGAIVSAAAAMDKAFAQANSAASTGASALERQAGAIANNKAQLAAYRQQADAAAAAADRLRGKIVEATLTGVDAGPLRNQLATVAAEMDRLGRESQKLVRANNALEGNYGRSAATLADVERTTRLVGAATAFAQQEADDLTRSLEAQTVAARQNAQVLQDIGRSQYRDSGKSASLSAEVFRASGLTDVEKQIEAEARATAAAAQAERDRADAVLLTNAALKARGRAEGNGGSAGKASETAFAQQLREEEAAAEGAAAAEKQLVDAADKLRAAINPLGQIQDRLNTELAEAERLCKAGKISATELAQAQVFLRNSADRAAQSLGQQSSGGALLGLRPHEVQNLGYQVNDVVTQLASGTSLTQALAQQGGQILQIFPRAGGAIAAAFSNPAVLAFVGTVGAIVLGLREAGDEAERLRGFMGLLTSNVDGGAFKAAELSASSKALDNFGLSAEDATKVVRQFVRDGIDPSRLTEFGEAAQNLADVTGIDVVDAAKQVSEAFTGGFEAVDRLDQAYGFLTSAQRENIKTLFEEGKASEARTAAFQAFAGIQRDAAEKSRGEWASAVRELSSAWDGFISTLADTAPIRAVKEEIDGIIKGATILLRLINGKMPGQLDRLREMSNLAVRIRVAEDLQARDPSNARALGIRRLREEYAGLKKQYDETAGAAQREAADTRIAGSERAKKADADLQRATAARKAAEDQANVEGATNAARQEALRFVEENYKFATESVKQAYIAQRVEEARTKALKAAADQRKREADEAKRAAEERRRGFIADIHDNGRQEVLSTARRFQGFDETRNRGDLQAFFRQNGVNVDPEMTAWCAAFVNAVLSANGIKGTGSLAARSFLNFGQDSTSNPQQGDVVVLRRGKNSAQGHVGFFDGFDQRGNVKVLGGNQRDGVNTQSFNRNDVLGFRRIPNAAQVAQDEQKAADDLAKRQEKFNASLDETVATRERDTRQIRDQIGATGEVLLGLQREAAIEDAIAKSKKDAADAGIAADDPALVARLARLQEVTGAYFDAQHARERFESARNVVDAPVDQLTALRNELLQQISQYQQTGQTGLANSLMPQLDAVNEQLRTATTNALAFYQALRGDTVRANALGLTAAELDAIILKLQGAQQQSIQWGYVLGISTQQIAQSFANTLTSAVDRFAQAIADGQSVTGAFKDAFLSFAADFLRQIANMIAQQLAFNAAAALLRSVGLATGGIGVAHGGAVVGRSLGNSRSVSPAWFSAATRYHTGGVVGLRPNEIPIIAQAGEEVLTRDDPRHRANGGIGGGGGGDVAVKNVVVYDAAEALERGFADKRGEKVFFAFLRANAGAVRSVLGG